MHPKDYKPCPDDGRGIGDYPDWVPVYDESKNTGVYYSYPEHRMDYGEPVSN